MITWSANRNIVTLDVGDRITLRKPIKFVKWFLATAIPGTDEFDLQEVASGISVAQDIADQIYISKFVPVADGHVGQLVLATLTAGKIEIHLKSSALDDL